MELPLADGTKTLLLDSHFKKQGKSKTKQHLKKNVCLIQALKIQDLDIRPKCEQSYNTTALARQKTFQVFKSQQSLQELQSTVSFKWLSTAVSRI